MKKQGLTVFLLFIGVLGISGCNHSKVVPADMVLIQAKIYTVNPKIPWAQAMAFREGKIIAVGSDSAISAYQCPSTKAIDAKEHMVLPGFMDAHVHIMAGAAALEQVALNDAKTIDDFQRTIKNYAAAHPDKGWIQGIGWYNNLFGRDGLPDKKFIDQVALDRPVYLAAYEGHSSLANSKAPQIAGIARKTLDPPNGIIVRNPATGEPAGFLKEAAGSFVMKNVPQPTREEERNRLTKAVHDASSLGLTRLISAGADAERVDPFDEIRRKGELTVRLYMARFVAPPISPDVIGVLQESRKKSTS
jgi:hypothetical protein